MVAPSGMKWEGASTCVPVVMLQVMVVLRTPSCFNEVRGSNCGRGCPGTGIVLSENGMVKSMFLPIFYTLPQSVCALFRCNIILYPISVKQVPRGRGEKQRKQAPARRAGGNGAVRAP